MTQQRLDRIEDEFETVKQLLVSAANYAQSAHEGLDELTKKQDRTQVQLDQLSVKVDNLAIAQDRTQVQLDQLNVKVDDLAIAQVQTEATLNGFIAYAQQQFVQHGERIERLDRSFLEFQGTTTAALERMDRILDYLLRQQGWS